MEKSHDPRKFTIERIMQIYEHDLRGLIRRHLPADLTGEVAQDDVLQAVWFEVHNCLAHTDFKNEGHFLGWIRRITHSRLCDALRRARAFGRGSVHVKGNSTGANAIGAVGDPLRTPSSAVAAQEATARLLVVIKSLSTRDQRIVDLHFLKGLTERQTSRVLGISLPTVRSATYRAKKELARLMGDERKFFNDS